MKQHRSPSNMEHNDVRYEVWLRVRRIVYFLWTRNKLTGS